MFDPSMFPPDEWEDLSYWEQIALLPEEKQEPLLRDLIRSGVDLNSPEITFRRKQREVLEAEERVILFAGGRGTGKLYCLNTPILTDNGFVRIGDIEVGTTIFDETGNKTEVTATYDSYPEVAYEFTFSDGTTIVSGGEHQWVTWTHRDRKKYLQYADPLERHEFPKDWPNWRRSGYTNGNGQWVEFDEPMGPKIRTTQDIVDTFYTTGKRKDLNHCIPLADPVQLDHKSLPVAPYALGYWLGNGSKNGVVVAGSYDGDFDHDDVLNSLVASGCEIGACKMYPDKGQSRITIKGLSSTLETEFDLTYHDKFVPEKYLLASESQRLALLQGLMDSDGYADPRTSVVEFCTTTKPLADAVLFLARSLSERPVLAEGRAKLNGKDYGPKWRVTWRPSRHNPFRLPRKAARVNMDRANIPQALRHRHRMITSYREVPLRPMRCLTVDSPNSMYLAGEALIPTHNTRVGGAWVNDKARKHPGCIIHLVGRTVADVRDVMVRGEALALDTPVPTPSGWTSMGEVKAGDFVLGADGKPTRVSWVSEIYENRPCYLVTFADGEQFVADENHKWLTWTHQTRRFNNKTSKHQPSVVTTKQISDTVISGKQSNHAIPNTLPLDLPEADLPIPPYTLGVWLGDGHTWHAAVTTMDREVLNGIINDGFAINEWGSSDGGLASTYGVLGLLSSLKTHNLRGNKHIPQQYLRSSYKQRLDLLRGLVDSDGSVSTSNIVEFWNTNKSLSDSVVELAASLGFKPTQTVRIPKNPRYKPVYRVAFMTSVPVATVARKQTRIVQPKTPSYKFRYIKSVEPVDSVPVRCLSVENDDQMFLIGRTMVPTHNSGLLAYAPPDFVPVYTPSTRSIEWPNGAKAITFSADASDQLRGPQSHYTWADELAAYPQKPDSSGATMWDNIEFSTRLGENPQILGTTTPKRVHVMRELFARAAAGQNTRLVQGSSWENRSNLSREYMEYIFNRFAGTHLERQELYGELIGDAPGALWNSEDIVIRPVPSDQDLIYVIGVDPAVTYGNDDTGIIVACATNERDPFKRQAWVLEDLTMNSPVEVWGKKVVELQREYSAVSKTNPRGNPAIVVVEKNQGGDLIKALFKGEGMSSSAPVVDVTAKLSKSQRAEPVVMAYRQKRVFHNEDMPLLVDELTSWEPSISKNSPNRLDALVWSLAVLLVDPRPIARWAPILVSEESDYTRHSLGGVNQPWKRDRGVKTGMGTAPWRRGR